MCHPLLASFVDVFLIVHSIDSKDIFELRNKRYETALDSKKKFESQVGHMTKDRGHLCTLTRCQWITPSVLLNIYFSSA